MPVGRLEALVCFLPLFSRLTDRLDAVRNEQERLKQSVASLEKALEQEQAKVCRATAELKEAQNTLGNVQSVLNAIRDKRSRAQANSSSPLARQFLNWSEGISPEIDFWDRWFKTRGLEWPEDFITRQRLDTEFTPWAIGDLESSSPKILDVGAGPMTKLGKTYKGQPLAITAIDPLAPIYSQLAAKYGISRPVETIQGFAEDLTAIFETNSFDVVYCINALDHSFDPTRGIEEMLLVCRIGGFVILEHNANEAEFENYEGFHQWNFDADAQNHFIIWNREHRFDVTERFSDIADVRAERNGPGLGVLIRKTNAPAIDLSHRSRERLHEVLAATLTTLVALS